MKKPRWSLDPRFLRFAFILFLALLLNEECPWSHKSADAADQIGAMEQAPHHETASETLRSETSEEVESEAHKRIEILAVLDLSTVVLIKRPSRFHFTDDDAHVSSPFRRLSTVVRSQAPPVA